MISRLVSKAAVIGVAATFAIAAPASAAAKPTLKGPEEVKGYAEFTMTGTADPGSTVQLYETAIGWNDMQPAKEWETGSQGPVLAKADASGKFTIQRYLDSGFYFEVHQGDQVSNRITVYSRVDAKFWVTSPANGTILAEGDVKPGQPDLPVTIQRLSSAGTWSTVANTKTTDNGAFSARITGLSRGEYTYRATVGNDPTQGVRGDVSPEASTFVEGPAPTTPTTPPTTSPTKPPTTPTGPAVGSVQFTKIQYDSPGTDSGSNGSLNTEWVKLTNKTTAKVSLSGWTVRDASGIVYKFSSTVSLAAGGSIFVQTGKGTNTATHRFWNRAGKNGYVWNNGGDTATLRTSANKTIDSCKWTKVGTGNTTC